MSDTINTIVDKQAHEQLERLAGEIKKARLEFIEFAKVISANSTNVKVNVPADLDKKLGGISNEYKRLEGSARKANAALSDEEKIHKKLIQSRKRLAESQSEANKEIQRNRDLANQNNREIKKTESLYGRVSVKLTKTAKEYKELSLRKQLLNNLTEKEAQRMQVLENRITKYNGALKSADEQTGNFSRNVGNYKSGFDGLGMSVAQLTREAPAFAHSMTTGFMAISNNIPMLVDELNRAKVANQELAASGKPTQNIMKQLAGAIFSWQTAISGAIVLLTIYGEDLINWASKMMRGNDAVSASIRAQKDYKNALNETRASMQLEVVQLETLLDIAGDETVSREKRNDAVKLLQDEYPDYLKNLTTENTKSQKIAESVNKITEALENKAKVQAAEQLITEKYQEMLEKRLDVEEDYAKRIEEARKIEERGVNPNNYYDKQVKGQANLVETLERQRKVQILEAKQDYEAYADQLAEIYKEIPNLLDVLGDGGDGGSGNGAAEREKVEAVAMNEKRQVIENTIRAYEDLIKVYKHYQENLATTSPEHKKIKEQIEAIENAVKTLKNEFNVTDLLEIDPKGLDKLQEHLNGKIPDAMSHLANDLGVEMEGLMQEFYTYYEGDYESFLDFQQKKREAAEETSEEQIKALATYMQMASDVFYEVGNLFSAISDNKIQKIEDQIKAQDKLLENELLNDEQREGIEKKKEELEEKKKKEKVKQAKTDKAFALFDIAINTAAAIMKTYAEFGFPIGVPLAITQGAIGALQLATVAARPIPKYKDGRTGGKAEMAIVGDGGRKEVITDKEGNVKGITPDKPTLTYLGEGWNVHKSLDDYDKVMRASLLTSINSQQLSAEDASKSFDENLMMQTIKEGFKSIQMNTTVNNDNAALLRELKFQRRRDAL